MLDANEAHDDKEGGLAHFMDQTALVDIHLHFHGSQEEPVTYNRGMQKIDHALCTQGFWIVSLVVVLRPSVKA